MKFQYTIITILLTTGLCLMLGCDTKVDSNWTGFGSSEHFPSPYENDHLGYITANPGNLVGCQDCHGADYNGGTDGISCLACHENNEGFEEKCNRCHGNAAGDPAAEIDQAPDTGAHQNHLAGGQLGAGMKCSTCHKYPTAWNSVGHIDALPAELTFSGISDNHNHNPAWNTTAGTCSNTYCHGDFAPEWDVVDGSQITCGSCHTLPPPAPHFSATIEECVECHVQVVDATGAIINPSLHVNGTVSHN